MTPQATQLGPDVQISCLANVYVRRMSPEDQAAFLKSKKGDAANFVRQYNDYAAQTGWVH